MKLSALLLALVPVTLVAQGVRQPLSVRYAGLGAYSKNFSDIFSSTANQASLAELKVGGFGAYGERRFLLNELKNYSAIIAIPTTSGTFGFQGDFFGFDAFNESQLGIMYGRKISKQVNIGAKMNYHAVRVAGYGSTATVNFELGSIFQATEKLYAGIHVYNPASSKLGKASGERLPSIYRFGMGYEASKKVFVSMEIVKQEDQGISINAGLQYNLHEKIFIRLGMSSLTNHTNAGVGIQLGFGRVDINAAYHPELGLTPGLLILINFKKPPKD